MQQQQLLSQAEADFQAAVKRWHAAANETERAIAAEALDKARASLILDHGYSLEQIVALVDAA
jgi:hypothetical protein